MCSGVCADMVVANSWARHYYRYNQGARSLGKQPPMVDDLLLRTHMWSTCAISSQGRMLCRYLSIVL